MRRETTKKRKPRRAGTFTRFRRRVCRFCKDKTEDIDYKDIAVLERMINERGKILSRRITGNCSKHQRKVAAAVKRARFVSLIPYKR